MEAPLSLMKPRLDNIFSSSNEWNVGLKKSSAENFD
jgi:hypothetical protein